MRALLQGYRLQQALGTNRMTLRRALAEMMPTAPLKGRQFESLLDDAARMSPEAMVGFLQALHRWNVEDELPKLRVRTLILSGGKDVLVPTAALAPMAQMLPRGELLVWSDVGHSPQLEQPDAFVHLLAASAKRSPVMRLRTWLWGVGQRMTGAPDLLAGFDESIGAE
jgi:pimeloyl-ACP methyl ester carboxylesterase